MVERSKFFDDLAGVAGGAFSAIAGVGEELGALVRTRVDEALASLSLVRREEFEVVSELAAQARAGQEAADLRIAALEARLDTHLESVRATPEGGQPAPAPHGSGEDGSEVPPASHDPHSNLGAPGGPPA
ncbi:accessory factor UbiK family protein [Lichenicoccus roseus]|uniref:Accessory factor UbiK family protein n=1 Tax=Lichenicoccus roseus TaxID=2683649 RepID=A0A5R9IZC0_9PROT|nr:accessory factor UbiK family protein [Lichenicoccus roseus]TLU70814.1 accessory factor UbiK family protein [Lichenicoccus roseus]